MSYIKSFTSQDIIVTPFTVHKVFSYSGTPPSANTEGVFVINGDNETYPLSEGGEGTGSAVLVSNTIKQLYYSNYLEDGENGKVSNLGTASFNPDGTVTGPAYTPNYINNIQSIDELRYFPTQSGTNLLSVLSIPSKLFGIYVKPGSYSDDTMTDDGQGNLLSGSTKVGNIIYEAGLVIFTESGSGAINSFSNPQWESSTTLYETQYKCTIRENEFNFSNNPSLLSGSVAISNGSGSSFPQPGSGKLNDNVTGSYFSPYITTVGLYNNNKELLAVAKLAQPLPVSTVTDTSILINFDF
jgi:hypothetical protein